MKISDSVILITGANRGLGRAMAEMLAQKGAKVAITGRHEADVNAAAAEIGALGIVADVGSDEDIDRTFETVISKFGKLDVLINNAGIGGWATVDEVTRDQIRRVYETNVFGAAVMGAKAAAIFKKQQKGNIINIASTAGLKGYANGSIYASSKFALRGMTECWRAELRPFNVRVMLVNPSEVPTAFGRDDRQARPLEERKLTPDEIAHAVCTMLEMDDRGFIPELSVWATNPF